MYVCLRLSEQMVAVKQYARELAGLLRHHLQIGCEEHIILRPALQVFFVGFHEIVDFTLPHASCLFSLKVQSCLFWNYEGITRLYSKLNYVLHFQVLVQIALVLWYKGQHLRCQRPLVHVVFFSNSFKVMKNSVRISSCRTRFSSIQRCLYSLSMSLLSSRGLLRVCSSTAC